MTSQCFSDAATATKKTRTIHTNEAAAANTSASNPLFANYAEKKVVKRDLTRWVRWPQYIRVQRQKKILYERLKVPPSINQFTLTLNKQTAAQLFRFCKPYIPETKKEKEQRLKEIAVLKAEGKEVDSKHGSKLSLKRGLDQVVRLIETKRAKLVVIAHDVDPVELVVYLPALCRKMGIPYVIVKGKARLGCLTNSKTATSIAITEVADKDVNAFAQLLEAIKVNYTDKIQTARTQWGGAMLSEKTKAKLAKRAEIEATEAAKRQAIVSSENMDEEEQAATEKA